MNENKIWRRNKNIVNRIIGEETVLLPVVRASKELNCIYTLNKSASWVWERLDGKKRVSDLEKMAQKEFTSGAEKIKTKMEKLFTDLEKIKAVV
jgi:hypothetical protein